MPITAGLPQFASPIGDPSFGRTFGYVLPVTGVGVGAHLCTQVPPLTQSSFLHARSLIPAEPTTSPHSCLLASEMWAAESYVYIRSEGARRGHLATEQETTSTSTASGSDVKRKFSNQDRSSEPSEPVQAGSRRGRSQVLARARLTGGRLPHYRRPSWRGLALSALCVGPSSSVKAPPSPYPSMQERRSPPPPPSATPHHAQRRGPGSRPFEAQHSAAQQRRRAKKVSFLRS